MSFGGGNFCPGIDNHTLEVAGHNVSFLVLLILGIDHHSCMRAFIILSNVGAVDIPSSVR